MRVAKNNFILFLTFPHNATSFLLFQTTQLIFSDAITKKKSYMDPNAY